MNIGQIIRFAQSLQESLESVNRVYEHLLAQFELERPRERDFPRNGISITVDGHSGAGKDTQIALLNQHMRGTRIYDEYTIVELIQKENDPFRQISKYLWGHPEVQSPSDCSLLLLTVGRRYFVYHTILPLLENPRAVVLLNRSYLSHIAYHASSIVELPSLIALSDFDQRPDVAFILECDADIAYSRVISRSPKKGGMVYKNEKPDYIERVKGNFRGLADLVNGLVFVDTSNRPELIAQEVSQKVEAYFQQ